MRPRPGNQPRKIEWPFIPISIAVLAICLWYTFAQVFLVPDSGLTINSGWSVIHIERCEDHPGWCEAHSISLQIGDQLIAIGDLAYDEYRRDRRLVPFAGYAPGDRVPITLLRNDLQQTGHWQVPAADITHQLTGLWSLLFYLPFWLAGTAVLLFMRPRHVRWRLLAAFHYLVAAWIAVGLVSQSHVAASSLVTHALSWLLVPVCLHLHLVTPTPLLRRRPRYVLPLLYAIAVILASLEFGQFLPPSLSYVAFTLSIVACLGLLIWRLFDRSSPASRLAAALMLAGIGLAFGPGLVLGLVPSLFVPTIPGSLAIGVALLGFPILPMSYTYAIYKRHLGPLEFRANRWLNLYSFILLCAAVFVFVFFGGSYWLGLPGESLVFSLVVSAVFIIAASILYPHYRRLIDRLAYGTRYDADELIHLFARQIPAALSLKALARLLTEEVTPSLFIRQSALCSLVGGDCEPVYASGVDPGDVPKARRQIQQYLAEPGQYRLPSEAQDEFDWVRLAIPLAIQARTIGIWLFGRRDPDDYYPQNDIALLTTLASQVAVAIENARLYEQAQQEIIERRRVEEALRISEERLALTIAAGGIGIYDHTVPLGPSTYHSERWAEILGYKQEELPPYDRFMEWLAEQIHPDDLGQLMDAYTDFVEGRSATYHVETRLRHKSGRWIYVEAFSRAVDRDGDGRVTRIVGGMLDITERELMTVALQEREALIRALIDAPTDIMLLTDLDGTVLALNDAAALAAGSPADALVGTCVYDLLGPDVAGPRGARTERIVRSGESLRFQDERGGRTFDGQMYPVYDARGNVSQVAIFARDITERVQAERRLKQTQERILQHNKELAMLHQVATEMSWPYSIMDALATTLRRLCRTTRFHSGIVILTQESEALPGYVAYGELESNLREEQVLQLGRQVQAEMVGSENAIWTCDVSDLSCPALSILGEGNTMIAGLIQIHRESQGVILLFNRQPCAIPESTAHLIGAVAQQIGIATENVRLLDDVARMKLLSEIDRLRSELIANVSHELRTPLGLIDVSCTSLLAEDVSFDRQMQRRFLQIIEKETVRLTEIVDNLLGLSRVEAGDLQLHKQRVDLNGLVGEALERIENRASERRLVYEMAPEALWTAVDVSALGQVLLNLLSNAVKYSPEGTDIVVRTHQDDEQIVVEVQDQGIGIPSQDLGSVFDRFYRGQQELVQRTAGIGLGLAICKDLIEAHDGRIWVESVLDVGTSVFFALPADHVPASRDGTRDV
jgi:PAS domain S-box-containing protein